MAEKLRADNQENVLNGLEDNILLMSQKIRGGEFTHENSATFVKDEYWNRMRAVFNILSSETTKISLAFSKKPFPSYTNTEQMVVQVERAMLSLVSAFYSLPKSQGASLNAHLKNSVLQILSNLQNFTAAVSKCLYSEKSSDRIQWTGSVWEAAEFELLTDNKACVLKDLRGTYSLVEDALGEIEEAKDNDGYLDDFLCVSEENNDVTWSEQDRVVVDACTGMAKTTRSVLKKSVECVSQQGDVSCEDGVLLLDEFLTLTKDISSKMDDFISGIYAPVNYITLVQNGKVASEVTNSILKCLRDSKLTSAGDVKWLDFLTHANTHNLEKLEAAVLPKNEDG